MKYGEHTPPSPFYAACRPRPPLNTGTELPPLPRYAGQAGQAARHRGPDTHVARTPRPPPASLLCNSDVLLKEELAVRRGKACNFTRSNAKKNSQIPHLQDFE